MSPSRSVRSATALILGGGLAAVAFGAAGGTELSRTTIVEVLLVLAGSGVIAAAVLWDGRGPLFGGTSLALFGLVAAFTALSVLWSVVPALSYIEGGRTLSYLVVFAAAVAGARLAPRATPAVLGGVLVGALLPVAYALASRVWPGTLAENELSNRIGAPFQYWNAVGSAAAIAIPAALWLGSRRSGSLGLRVLAYPAVGLCVVAILLTQSRGALAAALIGVVIWLVIVPLRLRTLPVLLIPALAGAAVAAWALTKDAFSKSLQPLAAKEAVAGEFGLLLVLLCGLLVLAGYAVQMGEARGLVSPRAQRRLGVVAGVVAVLLPLVAFTSVALSDKGLSGTFNDRVDELTSETEIAPEEGADRVFAASSTRGKYWREADRVFDDRPAIGTGAGAFAVARLRHRVDASVTRHAHGFVPQTMADLGWIGVALTSLLLLAWLAAGLRAASLVPRGLPFTERALGPSPRRDWDGDRTAVVALALVAVVFGLQSIVDWTWFVPGPALVALVAAGFVAGRGPVALLPGEAEKAGRPSNGRLLAAGAVVFTGLLLAWSVWQPEASERDTNRAFDLAEQGDFGAAVAKTEDAENANPLSPDPLLVRASIQTKAGQETAARESLEQAVLAFPGDPETWTRLTAFQLGTLDRPDQALETVRGALYLDPFSVTARGLFLESRARLRELQTLEARAAAAQQEP